MGLFDMSKQTNCANCDEEQASMRRSACGTLLCKKCFSAAFEADVHRTITTEQFFTDGENVVIGVSGGKDSAVVLHVLYLLNKRFNYGLHLSMLAVNEGIAGYRDDSLCSVDKQQKRYNIPLKVVSYKNLFGLEMDEIVQQIGLRNNCTYCGVFRRQALERGCEQLGSNKLVTGHNADDMAETILMNVLRGDLNRLHRCSRPVSGEAGGLVRCKPLYRCFQKEIVLYARFNNLDYFSTDCVYAPNSYRAHVRDFVKRLELIRPLAILDVLRSGQAMALQATDRCRASTVRSRCSLCGFVSSGSICHACRLLKNLHTVGLRKMNGPGRQRSYTSPDERRNLDTRGKQNFRNGDADNRSPYCTIHANPFVSPSACKQLINLPNVIIMVGLPARGKTYIAKKLCRYLNWIGITTKVFNLGDYRRTFFKEHANCDDFFNPQNRETAQIRQQCADLALQDVCRYLKENRGDVAIFDATNSTRERRQFLRKSLVDQHMFRLLFVESICDDPSIIETNIQDVKVNSPDYKEMLDKDKAKEDFMRRIEHYRMDYQPLDANVDTDLSFIKIFDVGRRYLVQNIVGHVQSRIVYFLMNIHILPRSIFLTRHGESEFNRMARLGGDSPLSQRGLEYAERLADYFKGENVPELRVWSSQKIRAVQTAFFLKDTAAYIEHWKALDEIDAGICEGLTYDEVKERYPEQFFLRDQDKFHYRYPSGESYEDVVARLEPVIMELERQENVLVVAHQAVLRCLLAYFLNKDCEEMPYLRVPLHSVVKLTPVAYGCQMELIQFDIEAVDTHRDKPAVSVPYPSSKNSRLGMLPIALKAFLITPLQSSVWLIKHLDPIVE
ncbi:6-phosphofructo-2-kinase/fructose-2,6-bisphosphatase 1, partial [Trichinella nelsoni]